jgi:hypothetical protein
MHQLRGRATIAPPSTTIDPFIQLEVGGPCAELNCLGGDAPICAPWYFGAEGQVAVIDYRPIRFAVSEKPSLCAAFAACLAAANIMRQVQGRPLRPVLLSAWDFREGAPVTFSFPYPGSFDSHPDHKLSLDYSLQSHKKVIRGRKPRRTLSAM